MRVFTVCVMCAMCAMCVMCAYREAVGLLRAKAEINN